MTVASAIETFATTLQEVSPDHANVAPWSDRADLPTLVREFWSRVGVSELSANFAPGPTPEQDSAKLAAVFESWFESAIIRDRLQLEPEDEPIPHRFLPEKARLLAQKGNRLLLASDVEPEPKLYVFSTDSRELVPVGFSYLWWCMQQLLEYGTTLHSGSVALGLELRPESLSTDLALPFERINDGLYLLSPLTPKKRIGVKVLFRNLETYASFVLARNTAEQGFFRPPDLPAVECLPTKKWKLIPQSDAIPSGFQRHVVTKFGSCEPFTRSLVGKLEGCQVWLTGNQPVWVHCDEANVSRVEAALVAGGANVQRVSRKRAALAQEDWLPKA